MDYIRDRKSNFSFSLHDSRIVQIEIDEKKLSLKMDRIFQYAEDEEKWYQGTIEFTKIDKEECDIMVFTSSGNSLQRSGRRNGIASRGERLSVCYRGVTWRKISSGRFGIFM